MLNAVYYLAFIIENKYIYIKADKSKNSLQMVSKLIFYLHKSEFIRTNCNRYKRILFIIVIQKIV